MKKAAVICALIPIIFYFACSCNVLDGSPSEVGMNKDIQKTNGEVSAIPQMADYAKYEDFNVSESDVRKYLKARNKEDYDMVPVCDGVDTLLYICNFGDGWLIISGDRRASPVIAGADSGCFYMDSVPEGILIWVDSIAEEIMMLKQSPYVPKVNRLDLWQCLSPRPSAQSAGTKAVTKKWVVIRDSMTILTEEEDEVSHLTRTKWGQESPWNAKLPYDTQCGNRCVIGCTAVAVAQLLYYLHYALSKPKQLYHTISVGYSSVSGSTTDIGFSRGDFHPISTLWNQMAKDSTLSGTDYSGDLMIDVGNRLGISYSGLGSGSSLSASVLANYSLTCSTADYSSSTVLDFLRRGMPTIASAYATRTVTGVWPNRRVRYSDGHAFLIDGIHTITETCIYTMHCEYTENWSALSVEIFDTFSQIQAKYPNARQYGSFEYECMPTTDEYLMMNWGYDGDYDNGYYSSLSDSIWPAGGHDLQYQKRMYYDFH